MIGALSGKILSPNTTPTIIMVGGVGYAVSLTTRHAASLNTDQEVFVRVHTVVKDDAIDLYGFATDEDMKLFTILLSVSGIGPKTALSIVNQTVGKVLTAVRKGDVDFFTTIPRLGKKNAQKIIIELKPKIGDMTTLDLSDDIPIHEEVTDALIAMGFRKPEILQAMKQVDPTLPSEVALRQTLKILGK